MATTERMAGDAEAAGAIAGMREVYGRRLPSIGQWVTGTSAGKTFSGEVASTEAGSVSIRIDDFSWIVVRPSDLDGWD